MGSISVLFDEQVRFQETLAAKQAELVKALFECMPAFPLSHACIVTDLTTSTGSVRRLIVMIDRRVGWTYPPALPKWEGGWSVDGFVEFPSQYLVSGRLRLLPLGGHRTRSVAER